MGSAVNLALPNGTDDSGWLRAFSAVVPSVLKASAEALKEFPELNARLEGDEIVYLDRYDLGVAVQTRWFNVGSGVPWAEPGVGATRLEDVTGQKSLDGQDVLEQVQRFA